jgi:hypothetical protein
MPRDFTGTAILAPVGVGGTSPVLIPVWGSITPMEQEPLGLGLPIGADPPARLHQPLVQPVHHCLGGIPATAHLTLLINDLEDFLLVPEIEVFFNIRVLLGRVIPVHVNCELYVVLLFGEP